jgi:hypothetical protein
MSKQKEDKKMSALQYIKRELEFKLSEWKELSEEDKDTLKRWAVEEMDSLGIEHV